MRGLIGVRLRRRPGQWLRRERLRRCPAQHSDAAHNLAAIPVFFGLPAATLACNWRSWRTGRHRFGLYSASTALTMLATTARAGAGFGQSPRSMSPGCSSGRHHHRLHSPVRTSTSPPARHPHRRTTSALNQGTFPGPPRARTAA